MKTTTSLLQTQAETLRATLANKEPVAAVQRAEAFVAAIGEADAWARAQPVTKKGGAKARLNLALALVPRASVGKLWAGIAAAMPAEMLQPSSFLERFGEQTLSPAVIEELGYEIASGSVSKEDWDTKLDEKAKAAEALSLRVLMRATMLIIAQMGSLSQASSPEDIQGLATELKSLLQLLEDLPADGRPQRWIDLQQQLIGLVHHCLSPNHS